MPDGEVTRARTARKPRGCDSYRCGATILTGHRYLVHTALPGYTEGYNGDIPMRLSECVDCAVHRCQDHLTGACLTFCHGDDPCARPFGHDGDHSCRSDADAAAPVGRTPDGGEK